MMRGSTSRHLRLVEPPHSREPRRFRPARGQLLTIENIRGLWRPSGTVSGTGVFAVVWETYRGTYWAPLHDFEPADQLRLIDQCRHIDAERAGSPR
jgi:hypothetical protein